MEKTTERPDQTAHADRCPGESYASILARDNVPPPDFYQETLNQTVGTEPIAASRYFDPAFLQQENDHVFPRVWQWACREEDIPEVGDYVVFDLGAHSWIVTRSAPETFTALSNACPHRGRQIAETDGHEERFRCPYHGLQWHLDGSLKHNPFGWDMPQWRECGANLVQARVETWGGFVFLNMDADAPPLRDVLSPIPDHFERYDFTGKYKAAHIIKKIRANWKATCEAFMESHHVVGTHPQALNMTGDLNSQYDVLSDYVGRQFTAQAVQSPNVPTRLSEQEIFNVASGMSARAAAEPGSTLPDGMTARSFSAAQTRKSLEATYGIDYSEAGDAEMLDSLLYHVFPNLAFWAGMPMNIVYRFRPNGMDPETSLMDILVLRPYPKGTERPSPAPIRYLDFDEPVALAGDDIGAGLAEVFDQDVENLPWVQKGLRALPGGNIAFTSYMEARLRRHHQMLDQFIADPEA